MTTPLETTLGGTERRLVVVLGGARSGKSAYAQSLAADLAGERSVIFLATAEARDDEMRSRIASHRAERPPHWLTIESPRDPAAALAACDRAAHAGVVLLDCVTLLVSNLLLDAPSHATLAGQHAGGAEQRVEMAITSMLDEYQRRAWSLVLVTNEVGMGLVPPYPLGRQYRDTLGRVNARLAQAADAVVLLVAGLPVELKSLAAAWQQAALMRLGSREPTKPDPVAE